jgi:hypothetical protein
MTNSTSLAVTAWAVARPGVIEITQVSGHPEPAGRDNDPDGNASSTSVPPGLVDTCHRRISPARTSTRVLAVNVTDDVVTGDPAASGLNAAARSLDARECWSPC